MPKFGIQAGVAQRQCLVMFILRATSTTVSQENYKLKILYATDDNDDGMGVRLVLAVLARDFALAALWASELCFSQKSLNASSASDTYSLLGRSPNLYTKWMRPERKEISRRTVPASPRRHPWRLKKACRQGSCDTP